MRTYTFHYIRYGIQLYRTCMRWSSHYEATTNYFYYIIYSQSFQQINNNNSFSVRANQVSESTTAYTYNCKHFVNRTLLKRRYKAILSLGTYRCKITLSMAWFITMHWYESTYDREDTSIPRYVHSYQCIRLSKIIKR